MGKRRSIKRKKQPINKKVRNAQRLTYYGIEFKSKLEVYTYKKLKEAKLKFQYEEHTFPLLEKFDYEGQSMELFKRQGVKTFDWQRPHVRGMTYTPDFVNMREKWVIECKGHPNETFPVKWKMFKHYMNEHHPGFILYMPRNQKHIDIVVKHIKNGKQI